MYLLIVIDNLFLLSTLLILAFVNGGGGGRNFLNLRHLMFLTHLANSILSKRGGGTDTYTNIYEGGDGNLVNSIHFI